MANWLTWLASVIAETSAGSDFSNHGVGAFRDKVWPVKTPALSKITSIRLSVYRRIPSGDSKFWTSDGVLWRNFATF